MNKFKFLITSSLFKKIKSKAFIISMIITSVLIMGITIVMPLISLETDENEITYNVVLIDQTDQVADIKAYLENDFEVFGKFNIIKDNNYNVSGFWEDNIDLLIIYEVPDQISNGLIDVSGVEYYSKLDSYLDFSIRSIVVSTKSAILIDHEAYIIDFKVIPEPGTEPIEPDDPTLPDLGFDASIMGFSTVIFTVMFMFITLSTQSMGGEILEEKSTKAIETIISSAPAEMHFFSKIISSLLFTGLQLIIMLAAGALGMLVSKIISPDSASIMEVFKMFSSSGNISIASIIIVSVLSVILGLVLYLVLFAFLASFANNNEEYQKAITPMMIILLIIFYSSMILSGVQAVGLIKGLSFVPFFTPFLLPLSVMMGIMSTLEIIGVFAVLIASIVFLTWILLPAYKVSILSYSSGKLFKEISRSIKTSRANRKILRKNNKK